MSGRTANEPLDEQIRDEDIEKIAGEYLSNWEKLRPHLKLSQVQEMEIRRTYGDYRDQKRAFLYRWKEKEGSGATYSAFIDAAKIASNRQLAENVTTMLQERLRQTSAPSTEADVKMVAENPLNDAAKAEVYKELATLENGNLLKDREEAKKIREYARNIKCFYCLDYTFVYKDRKGMFDNLDGRGSYDIVNCIVCKGNDHWKECSGQPESQYPGIVKRGVRERMWFEGKPGQLRSVLDKLRDKASFA